MFSFSKISELNPFSGSKHMKIGLLAENLDEYTNKRIIEAGTKLGHKMVPIQLSECYLQVRDNPTIYYHGEELEGFDALIPRVDRDAITYYGTALIRQFETRGVYTMNTAKATAQSRDKLRSMQILARHGIPMPETWFAHRAEDLPHIMDQLGSGPYVAKMLQGTEGKGVMLFDKKNTAISTIETFMDLNVSLLMQEFIAEAKNKDIRCFVVGGKVVATMQRTAPDGDFRANVSLGGMAEFIEPTPEEVEISLKAAEILKLNMAGVDLIRSKRGSLVIEVNVSPQIEGIERATKVDVASAIVKFVEKNAKKAKTAKTAGSK